MSGRSRAGRIYGNTGAFIDGFTMLCSKISFKTRRIPGVGVRPVGREISGKVVKGGSLFPGKGGARTRTVCPPGSAVNCVRADFAQFGSNRVVNSFDFSCWEPNSRKSIGDNFKFGQHDSRDGNTVTMLCKNENEFIVGFRGRSGLFIRRAGDLPSKKPG